MTKFTTIRVLESTALELISLRESLSDTYDDVITLLIKEHKERGEE